MSNRGLAAILCGLAAMLLGAPFAAVLTAQSDPHFDAIVKNADTAREAGNSDKAIKLYRQALQIKPGWKQGWWVLGSMLYDENRFQESEDAFLPLARLDPDKSAAWAMVGLCAFEIKHYQEALASLEKADHLGLPESLYDVTEYHIALLLIRAGEFDLALESMSRYARHGQANPKLVETMGIAALRKSISPDELPREDLDLVTALGRAMCDAALSHGKEATAEFEAILSAHPNVPQLHYLYGLVLLQSDSDKALTAFEQELTFSPQNARALISLAIEYTKRNDYQKALGFAERAVAADTGYFAAHATLGKVLVEGNLDTSRGVQELESAVAMAPKNPQSRLALASAYSVVGRKKDAATQRAEFLRLRTQIDANASGPK